MSVCECVMNKCDKLNENIYFVLFIFYCSKLVLALGFC